MNSGIDINILTSLSSSLPSPPARLSHCISLPITHNVKSKAEVDAVMQQARDAGAAIVKPAEETFWGGYAGYFQDPDAHLWEVAGNPQFDA